MNSNELNEFSAITLRGRGVHKAFTARRIKGMGEGWLRIAQAERYLKELNGPLAVWVIFNRRREPTRVGVSETVGTRLVWLQSRVGWAQAAVTTKGDVELRAVLLARRFNLPMPRGRETVVAMLMSRAEKRQMREAQSLVARSPEEASMQSLRDLAASLGETIDEPQMSASERYYADLHERMKRDAEKVISIGDAK